MKKMHNKQFNETARDNPSHIWIEPTDRCNTRCIHCRHYYSNFGMDMPDEIYRKIEAQVLDGATSLDLIGYGEPLLAKNFEKIFEDCLKRNIEVHTTTNGILLKNDALLEKIVRGGMRLCLSIDGARAETFEFVRPHIKWSWMIEILERIKKCREVFQNEPKAKNFLLRFNFVAMRQNIGDLPELVRLADKYGARAIFVMTLAGVEEPASSASWREKMSEQPLKNSPELVSQAFLQALALAARAGIDLNVPPSFRSLIFEGAERRRGVAGRIKYYTRMIKTGLLYAKRKGAAKTVRKVFESLRFANDIAIQKCFYPWNDAYFAANGDVFPCCVVVEKMGNLNAQDWREIWNGLPYRNLRRTIHGWNPTAVCRYCGFAPGINGGDERRYAKYFSKFQRENISLEAPNINFSEGFYPLEKKPDGSPSHRWMSKRGCLLLRPKKGAQFLRLLINPRCFDDLNPGLCRINGGAPHYFDNTCEDINIPIGDVSGDCIEINIEMEKTYQAVNDARDLALPVRGVQYLFA